MAVELELLFVTLTNKLYVPTATFGNTIWLLLQPKDMLELNPCLKQFCTLPCVTPAHSVITGT